MTNFARQFAALLGASKSRSAEKVNGEAQTAIDEIAANTQTTRRARRGLRDLDRREQAFGPAEQARTDGLRTQMAQQGWGQGLPSAASVGESEQEFVAERAADRDSSYRHGPIDVAPFVDPVAPSNVGSTVRGVGRGLRDVGRWINEDSLDAPERARPLSDGDWRAAGVETMPEVVVEAERPPLGERVAADARRAGDAIQSGARGVQDWTRAAMEEHPDQPMLGAIGAEAAQGVGDFFTEPWRSYERQAQTRDLATYRGDEEGADRAALRGLGDSAMAALNVTPVGEGASMAARGAARGGARVLRGLRNTEIGIREAPRPAPLQARPLPDDAPAPALQRGARPGARQPEIEAEFTPAASDEGAAPARAVSSPQEAAAPITQFADGRPMFGGDGRLMSGIDPTNPTGRRGPGLRGTQDNLTPSDRGVRIRNADGTESDLAVPSDPAEWRTLLGAHPWINSPSRAQLVIMSAARKPNGAARFTNDEIANATGYAAPPTTVSQAREAGVLIPERQRGAGGATADPGGNKVNAILDVLERAAAQGEALQLRTVAERVGSTPGAVRATLSQLRKGAAGTHRKPSPDLLARVERLDERLRALRDKLGAGVDPDTILGLLGTAGYWTAAAGATAAMMGDEASAQETGEERVRDGLDTLVVAPGGDRPSLDGAEIRALGPDRPDLALARLPDGREVILRSGPRGLEYYGEARRDVFDPLPDDFPGRQPETNDTGEKALAAALSGLAGVMLGRYGRRYGARRGQPLAHQGAWAAGAGGAVGAATGALTPEDDMLDRTIAGGAAGAAATAAGSVGREGLRRAERGLRDMPTFPLALRGRGRRSNNAPRAIGQQRESYARPEFRDLQAESVRWDADAPAVSPKTPPRLRPPRDPLPVRAARHEGERGSLFNRLARSPSFDRRKLEVMARDNGISVQGTRTAIARRIADAARANPDLLAKLRRLYPYLGIGGLGLTNQAGEEANSAEAR